MATAGNEAIKVTETPYLVASLSLGRQRDLGGQVYGRSWDLACFVPPEHCQASVIALSADTIAAGQGGLVGVPR